MRKKQTDARFCREDVTSYEVGKIDLGRSGRVLLWDGSYELSFSFSEWDGIFVRLKRSRPYKILFEYTDGAVLMNDAREDDYAEFLSRLNALKAAAGSLNRRKVFEQLELLADAFVSAYFRDK